MVLATLFSVLLCLMVLGFCIGAQLNRAALSFRSHETPSSRFEQPPMATPQFTLRFPRNELPPAFLSALREQGFSVSVVTEGTCLVLLLVKPNMANELELAAAEAQLVEMTMTAGGSYSGWLPPAQNAFASPSRSANT